jgi:hypothetical protein
MKSCTKRVGVFVAVAGVGGLFVLAATATGPSAKPVAVGAAPGTRVAVLAKSVGDWPSTVAATTATMPVTVPVPVVAAVAPVTTVQAPSKGGVAAHSATTTPSGFPPIPVAVPSTIALPPGPAPVTTPTLPTTTLPTSTVPSDSHISVTLQIDPPSPKVGETVHLTLRATGGAWCCTPFVYFNDGTPPWIPFGQLNTGSCPALSGTPSWRSDLTHVFTAPGVFTVQAEADGGSTCFAPPNFEWVYGRSSTLITVSP